MKSLIFTLSTVALLLSLPAQLMSQSKKEDKDPNGTIEGIVIDAVTKAPLLGASILIVGTQDGAVTGEDGSFSMPHISAGSYSLRVSHVAYATILRTDVIVKSKRITNIEYQLSPRILELEGLTATAGYFSESSKQPTSSVGYNSEEVRRAPGTLNDVTRVVSSLPSVAKLDPMMNFLVVRGGAPSENAFYLDNIEIPNINHFPFKGSSAGPISLLNVDYIKNVDFSSGGFSASYGNKLSSIMDIDYRQGNRKEFDGQLDLNGAGFGVAAEGPLANGKGSWMLSLRRSYLDLLVDALETGTAPEYSDYQGKLVYDLSRSDRISVIGIAGDDLFELDKETSIEDGNPSYGSNESKQLFAGANWRHLWNNGFSNTSISYLSTEFDNEFFETKSDQMLIEENSTEKAIQLRNVNVYQIDTRSILEFGVESKLTLNDYDYQMGIYTNPLGDTIAESYTNNNIETPQVGLFSSVTLQPLSRLTTTIGMRYDYLEYNNNAHLSPRVSLKYQLTNKTALTGAFGVYYQNLSFSLLVQQEENKALNDPRSYHYVLGMEHMLSKDTKFTVETYFKDGDNYPLDPIQPQTFITDDIIINQNPLNYSGLVDEGKTQSYGVEAIVQKKLAEGIYGLVSGTYSKSKYQDFNGVWRDRISDSRFGFSVEGGYKPNNKWEFSMRWIYASGSPYTPLDLETSGDINRSVFDRTQVNQERYSDFHSMNVRVDRRFNFRSTNLILYFSVMNFYNQENLSYHFWNEIEQKQDSQLQWGFLPILGVEFEF